MTYVDGFMAPVATADKDGYLGFCKTMGTLFRKHGATSVVDCWGDDVPDGENNSMRSAVMLKDGETVVFGWIVWPDKETRDKGWKSAMEEPEMSGGPATMPFDGKRMIFGGFEKLAES